MGTRALAGRCALAALLLASACSSRNCDNDALRAGRGGGGGQGAGGDAGGGMAGGGTAGAGGEAPGEDCDGDGVFEDLASDAAHCGVCGHLCFVHSECVQGHCVVAEEGDLTPQGIHADNQRIYFVGSSNGALTIFDMDEDGGGRTPNAVASGIGIALGMDLHVHDELVTVNVPDPNRNTLLGFAAWGDLDNLINATVYPDQNPVFVSGEGQRVCWLISPPAAPAIHCRTGDTVHDPIPLSSQAAGLSLVGAAIHWSDAEGRLWRADPDPNAVPPVMYDAHIPGVGPLAVAGNDAYIVTPDGIWRAPVRAEAGEMIVDGPIAGAWDVIVVGARIYWTTLGGGGTRAGVFRAPVEGGVAERIYTAAEAQVTGYLTASGPYVYFGMLGEDRVLRHRIDAGAFPDPP